jgi:DNA-binding CsgD family transcriptional regulator
MNGRCIASVDHGTNNAHDRAGSDSGCWDPGHEDVPPLVGRNAELRVLDELLGRTRAGYGGGLLVRGEIGTGKSRLLTELHRRAADDFRVQHGVAVKSESAIPYSGLHQLVHPLLRRMDGFFRPRADTPGPAADDHPQVAMAVLGSLAEAAGKQPYLLMIDDAQYLDHTSRKALLFIARRLRDKRIAIVFAIRDGEPPAFTGSAFPASALPELRVGPLPRTETRELVRHVARGAPERVIKRLVAESAGNLLAAIELSKALTDGMLHGREPLPERLPCGPRLPGAFGGLIRALPPTTLELVLVAAANDADDIQTTLAAGLLLDLEPAALAPAEAVKLVSTVHGEPVFRYPFLRSIIYTGAPLARRQVVHQALATALSGLPYRQAWHLAAATPRPDDEIARRIGEIAVETRQLGGLGSAIDTLERAATLSSDPLARARFLLDAAGFAWQAGQPRRAADLQKQVAALGRQTAQGAACPRLHATADLLNGVVSHTNTSTGSAYRDLLDSASHAAPLDPMLASRPLIMATRSALASGDAEQLAETGRLLQRLSLPVLHPIKRFGFALVRMSRKDLRQSSSADQTFSGMLDFLAGGGDGVWPAIVPPPVVGLGIGARDALACAVGDLRTSGARGALPLNAVSLMTLEYLTGRWDSAVALGRESLSVAEQTGQFNAAAQLRAITALLTAARGQTTQCHELVDRALKTAVPNRITSAIASAQWALALAALGTGSPEMAVRHYEEIISPAGSAHHYIFALLVIPDMVESYVRIDQRGPAGHVLKAADDWQVNRSTAHVYSGLLRARALLATDPQEAEALFRDAVRWADGAPFELARAELLFGEWLRRGRRIHEARNHLHIAMANFAMLEATPWQERTRAELRSSGDAQPPARPEPDGGLHSLTPQEFHITQFAAQGMTNPEIAARLFISSRTVRYHLSKVFQKLNITSRHQLRDLDLPESRAS